MSAEKMTSGPKHLWSGNWRSESKHVAAASPQAVERGSAPAPPPTRARRHRRDLVIAVSAALVGAAATLAAVASVGGLTVGSGSRKPATASTPYGATADWLGMQIGDSPTGIFINAMSTSGAAIVSGLEPGDQVVAIDNRMINSVPEIRSDTNRLKIGAPVEITVLRNSVKVRSQLIPMMQRPTIHR